MWTETADLTTSATPGTATPLLAQSTLARRAFVFAKSTNTGEIRIGFAADADLASLFARDSFEVAAPPGAFQVESVDLNKVYVKSAAANQAYRVIYA